MHEGNFTNEIVLSILETLKKYPGRKAKRVSVKVGEMLHLEGTSVRAHFDAITSGTALEGVALELEEEPVRLTCRACQWQGIPEDHHMVFCGSCSSTDVEVLSGRHVVIDSIEF